MVERYTEIRIDTDTIRLFSFIKPYTKPALSGEIPTIDMASVDDRDQDEVLYDSPKKKQKKGTPDVPYYLRNFNTIVNHVLQNTHNQTLFPAEELQLLWLFQELSGLSFDIVTHLLAEI